MSTRRVAPGVWRVTTPLAFRPRAVHAYLLDAGAGRLVLVDGGADTDDAWAALDRAVSAMPGGWSAIALHLVTHMHTDHIGLAARVRSATGAPLAMGWLDAERVAHARTDPAEEAVYRERMLTESGADPALVAWAGRAGGAPRDGRPDCDLPLAAEGAPIHAAPAWEHVWTPGHTAGHVSLFRPADGVLIGGDAVLPRISPTIGVNRQRADPVGDYLGTLDRLAALEPTVVMPGHGEPIAPPLERIAELRAGTLEESRRVRDLLRAGPATVAEVVAARYPGRDLPDPVRVQAIRETRAHLDRLVAAGEARAERTPDAVRFWHL